MAKRTVRARNETRGTVIAERVTVATSIWDRFWGLMGRKQLPDGHGLHLTPCSSVHMFFMRFPLDVVFIDRANQVTKVAADLKPWRASLGGGGHSALELPVGVAAAAGLEVGDVIAFEAIES